MNKFSLWLHQAGGRLSASFRSFMSGRYGSDRLNMAILCCGLAASILSSLFRNLTMRTIFWALSYALMIWAIFRALSRNTYKRYQENRKKLAAYNHILKRISDIYQPEGGGTTAEGAGRHENLTGN